MTAHDVHIDVLRRMPHNFHARGFLQWLNRTVERIYDRGEWDFQFKREYLDFKAEYDTGTVQVTNGDATVVGTGTAWDTDSNVVAGMVMDIGGVEYFVASVTDDTNLELTKVFGGASATGLSYSSYQHIYTLATDVRALARIWDLTNENELYPAVNLDLKRRHTYNADAGEPCEYAIVGESAGDRQIMVWPYPRSYARVEYWYTKQHTALSTIGGTVDVPSELDQLVIQGAYAEALEVTRDPIAQQARIEFNRMLEDRWNQDKVDRDLSIRLKRSDRFENSPMFPLSSKHKIISDYS